MIRDVDLDKSIVDKYNVGDIIYERAFVDTTLMIGKPIKKVRYSILSNHAVELNTLMEKEEDKNPWGLCLINRDAAFKVLDKYEYNNTTLITLLHIPLEYDEIFKQIKINLDDEGNPLEFSSMDEVLIKATAIL